MEVTLVGTGAIYTKYNSASTLLDGRILVDIPNGAVKEILKLGYDVANIDMVVITHLHADHFWDMPFLWGHLFFKKRDRPLHIVGPKGTKAKMCHILEAAFDEAAETYRNKIDIRFIEISQEMECIDCISGYQFEIVPVEHGGIQTAYGYIVNEVLGLTGDSTICKGAETIIQKSSIIIADASCLEGDKFHMGLDDIQKLIKKYGKPMIATHLREETRKEAIKNPIEGLKICEDGYTFTI